jgi:uncharacterized protein with PQ loop repeat
MEFLEEILGWIGACTSTLIGLPQLVRLWRTRDVSGLSPFFWMLKLGLDTGWALHGLNIGKWNMVVPNALALLITLAVLWLLHRERGLSYVRLGVPGTLLLGALTGLDWGLGSFAFGLVAGLLAVVASSGQSVDLLRSPKVTGVSPLFLVVYNLNQAIWITWSYLVNDSGTIIAGWLTELVVGFNLLWWVARTLGVPAVPFGRRRADAGRG